ncbi:MAG: hypothetical protein JWR44_3235 [Hymenobacter sp.]|jgi:hypothetical protein|nr:hypothetical protein [Hymenobacter sp.]
MHFRLPFPPYYARVYDLSSINTLLTIAPQQVAVPSSEWLLFAGAVGSTKRASSVNSTHGTALVWFVSASSHYNNAVSVMALAPEDEPEEEYEEEVNAEDESEGNADDAIVPWSVSEGKVEQLRGGTINPPFP